MGVIFASALAARLHGLDRQTLECDELYTMPAATGHQYVYLSSESNALVSYMPITKTEYRQLLFPETRLGLSEVRGVLKRNVHLPFYFYMMHYWIGWFGNSEWVLRFPSALFGALTAVLLFILGRELFNPFIGLIAALFLSFSPEQIYFSQQARMYPLLMLLLVSSTYVIILIGKSPTNKWLYLAYAVLSTAGLYTHYEYIFCLAAQVAYVWLVSDQGRRHWRYWLGTDAAVGIAFLPWILISLAQKKTSPEIIAWVNGTLPANIVLTEFITKTARLISVPELPFGWVSVLVAFVLLIMGAIALAPQRTKLLMLCLWIACPLLGVVLMDNLLGTRAISITRYWLAVAPPLYLLIAVGVDRIKQRPVKFAIVATLTGFLIAAAVLTARGELRAKPDRHKELAEFVDHQVANSSGQIVLTEGLNALPLVLAYYGGNEMSILRAKWLSDQLSQRSFHELTNGSPEILLLVSGQSQASELLKQNGFHLDGRPVQFGHVTAARYVYGGAGVRRQEAEGRRQ
jgi:uncharacterized membrane protein